jgi:hypothetical protein
MVLVISGQSAVSLGINDITTYRLDFTLQNSLTAKTMIYIKIPVQLKFTGNYQSVCPTVNSSSNNSAITCTYSSVNFSSSGSSSPLTTTLIILNNIYSSAPSLGDHSISIPNLLNPGYIINLDAF